MLVLRYDYRLWHLGESLDNLFNRSEYGPVWSVLLLRMLRRRYRSRLDSFTDSFVVFPFHHPVGLARSRLPFIWVIILFWSFDRFIYLVSHLAFFRVIFVSRTRRHTPHAATMTMTMTKTWRTRDGDVTDTWRCRCIHRRWCARHASGASGARPAVVEAVDPSDVGRFSFRYSFRFRCRRRLPSRPRSSDDGDLDDCGPRACVHSTAHGTRRLLHIRTRTMYQYPHSPLPHSRFSATCPFFSECFKSHDDSSVVCTPLSPLRL